MCKRRPEFIASHQPRPNTKHEVLYNSRHTSSLPPTILGTSSPSPAAGSHTNQIKSNQINPNPSLMPVPPRIKSPIANTSPIPNNDKARTRIRPRTRDGVGQALPWRLLGKLNFCRWLLFWSLVSIVYGVWRARDVNGWLGGWCLGWAFELLLDEVEYVRKHD